MDALIERLLSSDEPSVRLSVRVVVLGEGPQSPGTATVREEVRRSPRVRALLDGVSGHPYGKWRGAHWVLVDLAELGYPVGDAALQTLVEQELSWLLEHRGHTRAQSVRDGRAREHASMEGNALFALLQLGLLEPDDPRLRALVDRLLAWQWPDGGWNCDKRPQADTSSFMESLTPLRGLALYSMLSGDARAVNAVARAAEVFLARKLYKRRSDGAVMNSHFVKLHYPCYWHYDILFALQVLKEAGFLGDARCADALDLLEAKQLREGGWPAEATYWRYTARDVSGRSAVRWGSVGKTLNEFVTARALGVLHAAGRV